eukprot:CAMPEP_0197898168 /NCGR_PEP_ID=MMETSP1439-20131203/43397_1 /TAXON_ID=66791 /ORGANISM="Gonyaulax spinifera, Strain CCMP409" /LENGTH=159 /DNA_ID=CAMNT_0043518865 /DNA_START=62 /DNA_END=538 /DNA_ORIENTATION=-
MDASMLHQVLATLDDQTAAQVLINTLKKRPELAPPVVNGAVPDLTYAPAEALVKRRSTGVLTSVSPLGSGYISCPQIKTTFGTDVYVDKNQIGPFEAGAEVTFAVLLSSDMKPQAFDLLPPGGWGGAGKGKDGGKGGCWGKDGGKGGWGKDGGWGGKDG